MTFFEDNKFVENINYELKGTSCENVVNKEQCIYPKNVQQLFPDDHYLKENNIESYLGYPLRDVDDTPIGIIAVLDNKPFNEENTEKYPIHF